MTDKKQTTKRTPLLYIKCVRWEIGFKLWKIKEKIVRYMNLHYARVFECDQCGHFYKLDGESNECPGCYEPESCTNEHAFCWNRGSYEYDEPCEGDLHADGTCKCCGGGNKLSFFALNPIRNVCGYFNGNFYKKHGHIRWIIKYEIKPKIHDKQHAIRKWVLLNLYARLHR